MATIAIDRTAKQIVLTVQEYSLFAWRALLNLFRPPIYWTDFLIQSDIIGVGSLPIVILSGFFTGGVLALQSAATLSEFGATAVTGQFVSAHHDPRTWARCSPALWWPAAMHPRWPASSAPWS